MTMERMTMERMIEESATVVATEPGRAHVRALRRSACSRCGQGDSCGVSIVSRLLAKDADRFWINDPIGLATGDRVVLGISGGTLLRASLIAYVLPLAGLVLAAAMATTLALDESLVALVGLAGLGAGLWLGRRASAGTPNAERFRPILLRREHGPLAVAVESP